MNAGKSSLVNRLLGQERTIVTPIAGTTRDAVDTRFEREGKSYTLIDTAGGCPFPKTQQFLGALSRFGGNINRFEIVHKLQIFPKFFFKLFDRMRILLNSEFFERKDIEEDGSLKIAVVGKPNAGKSSLVNRQSAFPNIRTSDDCNYGVAHARSFYRIIEFFCFRRDLDFRSSVCSRRDPERVRFG